MDTPPDGRLARQRRVFQHGPGSWPVRRTSSSAATATARHSAARSDGIARSSSSNVSVAAVVPSSARRAANITRDP
ncbi:hypothetical protein ACFPN7_48540 [Amycolatopsis halotolerans]|uniref:hypothetical protein n=1 Tax=Amycolatopsis halotolerans TaxID=330083 RepID=UPI00360C2B53